MLCDFGGQGHTGYVHVKTYQELKRKSYSVALLREPYLHLDFGCPASRTMKE